ncbi:hypothetical protein [Falsiroseomonas sp. CW058]|uniref:hypothetical protein n=1 Tax=Falsiroseomonas sp. CW058 TaxID=3388664 RepID=UPI003D31D854
MGQASHLYRRSNLWYWRRRVTRGPARGRPIALSLGTEERARARRAGAALDAVFEELMSEADDRDLPPGTYEAIMLAARDAILLRLAGEHAARGPDLVLPAAPPIRDEAEVPPKTQAKLAAFLAKLEAREADAEDEEMSGAKVPKALADELLSLLPKPSPPPKGHRQEPTLPSRTTAARARAHRSRAFAEILRADRAANDFTAARELASTVLGRLGLSLSGRAAHQAGSAVMEGMMKAYLHDVDVNLGHASPTGVQPPIGWTADATPMPAPAKGQVEALPDQPVALQVTSPVAVSGPPPAWDGSISPDMPLSEAFKLFATSKSIGDAWKDDTSDDAQLSLRIFVELFGDLPLRQITKKTALDFQAALHEICSDWGQNRLYSDPTADNPNRRVHARRAIEISRERRKTEPNRSTLSQKTIGRYTGFLNSAFNWVIEDAECRTLSNPFRGLQKKPKGSGRKSAAKDARDAFQIAEMQRIFTSPLWSSKSPFTDETRTALRRDGQPLLYFGMLLAAYCGIRQQELSQLRVGDITLRGELAEIAVQPLEEADYAAELGITRHTEAEQKNSQKSVAADRAVPVHPVLRRCGFFEYLTLRGGRRSDFLFTDIGKDAKAGARKLARFFLLLRRELDLGRPKTTFHSLRHTVRTMLDSITGDELRVDAIIGHESTKGGENTGAVYRKGRWLRPLHDDLAKLSYGIRALGEDDLLVRQMQEDGFVLSRMPLIEETTTST